MPLIRFAVLLLLAARMPAQTAHFAVLKWNVSSDAAANPTLGYNLYKFVGACPATATGFSKVNSTPISALTFTDSGLGVGAVCYYVTSTLNGAESAPSNLAGGTVNPANVTVTITVQ